MEAGTWLKKRFRSLGIKKECEGCNRRAERLNEISRKGFVGVLVGATAVLAFPYRALTAAIAQLVDHGPAPFEVDNALAELQSDGKYSFTADVYNAQSGYDTFGFSFDVEWSNDSKDELKASMQLARWINPKYTYHGAVIGKSKDGIPLTVKSVKARPTFAMAADGTIWGDLDALKTHFLQREVFLRQGGGR